jgi:hypothetical protein
MTKAQYAINDTIRTERIVVKSAQFGISFQDNYDTYLSNYKYTGGGLHFNHESFRDARTGNYKWKYQILFNSRIGLNAQKGNLQLSGIAGCSWSGYHPFSVGKRLKLLAGAQIQLEGGALYNPGNGYNPAATKLRTALAATGMAIYHFPVLRSEWIARYHVDIPLAGVMFAPEFGQSYYEIFGLGHAKGIISFTHPGNNPSWRHTLSLDIPMRIKRHSTTLRISYTADIYQSRINSIDCHIYRHRFALGFARTIFKIKRENRMNNH